MKDISSLTRSFQIIINSNNNYKPISKENFKKSKIEQLIFFRDLFLGLTNYSIKLSLIGIVFLAIYLFLFFAIFKGNNIYEFIAIVIVLAYVVLLFIFLKFILHLSLKYRLKQRKLKDLNNMGSFREISNWQYIKIKKISEFNLIPADKLKEIMEFRGGCLFDFDYQQLQVGEISDLLDTFIYLGLNIEEISNPKKFINNV